MSKPKKELTFEEKVLKELKDINKRLKSLETMGLKLRNGLALLAVHVSDSIPDFSDKILKSRLYSEYRVLKYLETNHFFAPRKFYPWQNDEKEYDFEGSGYTEDREKFEKFVDHKMKEVKEKGVSNDTRN